MLHFLSLPLVLMYILNTAFGVKPKEKALNYSFLPTPKMHCMVSKIALHTFTDDK